MRYLIKFSYDGSNYAGFQNQPGLNTIQFQLEEALKKVNDNTKTTICATGRTDKGVHALCQYAHTDISVNITEEKLKRALNSNLPDDIHIISTKHVSDDFHARYNVKGKEYKYYINLGEYNPIERNYVFQYNHELNVDSMKEAIKYFIGTHDYRAFVTENKFSQITAVGLSTMIACQTLVIIAGIFAIIPLTGITLPFVSYGGSSILTTYFALGLLQKVSEEG